MDTWNYIDGFTNKRMTRNSRYWCCRSWLLPPRYRANTRLWTNWTITFLQSQNQINVLNGVNGEPVFSILQLLYYYLLNNNGKVGTCIYPAIIIYCLHGNNYFERETRNVPTKQNEKLFDKFKFLPRAMYNPSWVMLDESSSSRTRVLHGKLKNYPVYLNVSSAS